MTLGKSPGSLKLSFSSYRMEMYITGLVQGLKEIMAVKCFV